MRDLHLWRLLQRPTPDPAEVAPLLADLADLPLAERAPFFGLLQRPLEHADAGLRRAALRALGGATGRPAIQRFVHALGDADESVRQAAVAALRLSVADSDWARQQLDVLATKSPQTVKVAFRQLQLGAQFKTFAENMELEYRIACRVTRRPDFVEGVRAVIVEKDNAPRWSPPTLEGVSDELLDEIFAPLPPSEAWSPLS